MFVVFISKLLNVQHIVCPVVGLLPYGSVIFDLTRIRVVLFLYKRMIQKIAESSAARQRGAYETMAGGANSLSQRYGKKQISPSRVATILPADT